MANILVLDDVQDVATMLKAILEAGGHKVFTFTEEQDAIEHARSHPIDLAILDIKFKRITGIEVLEELKKIDPHIHVMILYSLRIECFISHHVSGCPPARA